MSLKSEIAEKQFTIILLVHSGGLLNKVSSSLSQCSIYSEESAFTNVKILHNDCGYNQLVRCSSDSHYNELITTWKKAAFQIQDL